MFAVLSTLIDRLTVFSAPLAVMLLIAIVALSVIGIVVRRLRAEGALTFANASTSAAAATLVLAGALLGSAAIGAPMAAVASTTHPSISTDVTTSLVVGYQQIPLENLEGYQLPTE